MEKFKFSAIALAALTLATASCSKEGVDEPQGEVANVTFVAQLPSGLNQRAPLSKVYGDGQTAKELYYAVYEDGKTTPLEVCTGGTSATEGKTTFAAGSLTTTVTLKLPTDKKYDIVFFAKSANAPYEFSATDHNFTIDYNSVEANDENLDAFYAKYDYDGTSANNNVTLYRPFAQLNIGTDDLDAYNLSGTELTKTEVTVTGVGKALDLLDGTVSGEATVTYKSAVIPGANETFPKDGYKYLAMDYVLASADQALVDVTLKSDAKPTVGTYANVPVQRNYRTNIYGSLLTKSQDFNVTIDPAFETPDYEFNEVTVSTSAELAEAVKTADANVKLAANTTFNIPNSIAKGVTISGTDKTSILNVQENGLNRDVTGLSDVTFKNLTINGAETTSSSNWHHGLMHSTSIKFESCNLNGEMTLYANECTFDNCTFNKTAYDYCIFTYGCQKATFNSCTFNTVGKAVKVYNEGGNSTEATFNNCSFIATSVKDKTAITVDDTQLGSDKSFTININNCTQEGFTTGEFLKVSYLYDVEGGSHTTVVLDGKTVYPE